MNVSTILAEKGENVFTAKPEDSLLDIAQTLRRHRIGCIVITDKKDAIAGIVSERDLVRAVAERGADVLDAPVGDHMTSKVTTCTVSDTINDLMESMAKGRFRHLPVVDGNKLIGLVSVSDVVRLRIAEAELEASALRSYIATG